MPLIFTIEIYGDATWRYGIRVVDGVFSSHWMQLRTYPTHK